jgi:hypothetical protein
MRGTGIGKGPGGTYVYREPTTYQPPVKVEGPGFKIAKLGNAFELAVQKAETKFEAAELMLAELERHGLRLIRTTRKIAP